MRLKIGYMPEMVDSLFQLLILSLRMELQDKKRTMLDLLLQGARDNGVTKKWVRYLQKNLG
ncbi:hypothetical protein TUMSATVNIG3_44740 [Vibrio nigripulchritudo]|nr:hypothetical protein TUMSATVNIG2_44210 [Vibrio nigripulchritudo]BDU45676.1 hypothetical protein TUMSATVNIG3_44740 [Vibrio nigripulchritudo]